MTATYLEARDEILAVFKAAWDTTGHAAVYENIREEIPTTVAPWCRATVKHVAGQNVSLTGSTGLQRFERRGFFTAQIFVPIGEGLTEALTLAKVVADAFEGTATASGVWFRNTRLTEIGPDGQWYQVNVIVDFIYDEVK